MYIMRSFTEEGFLGIKWASDAHRKVADHVLLGNPAITTKDRLVECAEIINNVPDHQIKRLTIGDIAELGIPTG